MDKQGIVGFVGTAESMCIYFERVIEAEKKMGPLSVEEKITILKTLTEPITLEDLCDQIAGKRVLQVKHNEKHTEG